MIRILVTGSNGQLGSAIKKQSADFENLKITFTDVQELDLTNDQQVNHYFANNRYAYIINCAAYTAVDQAEKNPGDAFIVNASVPERLGSICNTFSTRLIHISTDYVFSGNSITPYTEEDETNAVNLYGKTKLEGEKALWPNTNALIIRTSWLYSEFGANFLKTMVRLSKERKELGVVFDQIGCPTYADDLASAILIIVGQSEKNGFNSGVYHYSNEGVCSWFDFATEIMKATNSTCVVHPIRTSEYPLPAKRPGYSVFDKKKIKSTFGIKIPYWRDSLLKAIQNL
jgi:dTDP-4-dehydrorhamnose reductase